MGERGGGDGGRQRMTDGGYQTENIGRKDGEGGGRGMEQQTVIKMERG